MIRQPRRSFGLAAIAISTLLSSCPAPGNITERYVQGTETKKELEPLISNQEVSGGIVNQPHADIIQSVSTLPELEKHSQIKYAILISGSNEKRDKLDLTFAYQILLEDGFERTNIHILDSDGKETQLYPVEGRATKSRIKKILGELAGKIEQDDLLFVYFTGHGDRGRLSKSKREDVSAIELSRTYMNQIELKKLLDQIRGGRIVVLADVCYGGGIAQAVSSKRCIGISGCKAETGVYGDVGDTFGFFFMGAYRDIKESDLNRDGRVSIDEAFLYAGDRRMRSRRRWTEPTIYPSETDAGSVYLK